MIRVLALVPYPADRAPGQRYRIEQWAPLLLHRAGVQVTLSPSLSRRGTDLLYEPGHVAAKAQDVLRRYLKRLGRFSCRVSGCHLRIRRSGVARIGVE